MAKNQKLNYKKIEREYVIPLRKNIRKFQSTKGHLKQLKQ